MSKKGLSTESYKGVRDFYPEDMTIQNYIFCNWKKSCENFGYEEYNASPLESADLYRAKSGAEIVNEQTYTFTDRGDREVTLRPEMTPTLARMVAQKQRELTYPLRWYSIPNVFRYEKPQRGRLREHFQLNVDMFGVEGIEAEIEMISLASKILKDFGATNDLFKIYINDRKIIDEIYNIYGLGEDERYTLSKLIDKKDKISRSVFRDSIAEILGEKSNEFISDISSPLSVAEKIGPENKQLLKILQLIETLSSLGIDNVEFNPILMRGFDYYTGIVFEVFDNHPDNNRSLFGGGRFDKLLDIFGQDPIPALGFGMGDVTMRDFLETHDLLPNFESVADLYICNAGVSYKDIMTIAQKIRTTRVNVVTDMSAKKVSDQIQKADKMGVPFIMCVGENELESKVFKLKELSTGETFEVAVEQVASIVNPHTVHIKPTLEK